MLAASCGAGPCVSAKLLEGSCAMSGPVSLENGPYCLLGRFAMTVTQMSTQPSMRNLLAIDGVLRNEWRSCN